MSLKSRVSKLEDQLRSDTQASVCSREQFDERVERLKVGLERFGYKLTNEEVQAYVYAFLKARPGFVGFGFDLEEEGMSGRSLGKAADNQG